MYNVPALPGQGEKDDAHSTYIKDAWIQILSLIHISEPTRRYAISYAVFCLKKKK